LNNSRVTLSVGLPGYRPNRGSVVVNIDGRQLSDSEIALEDDLVQCTLTLADGSHTAGLEYHSSNPFSRHLHAEWAFVVDVTPPTLDLLAPASIEILETAATTLELGLNEPASLSVAIDGTAIPLKVGDQTVTAAHVDLELREGMHTIHVAATDAAGNRVTKEWQVWADFATPEIALNNWPEGEWRETSATVGVTVTDSNSEELVITADLDGENLQMRPVEPDQIDTLSFEVVTGELAEGTHELKLTATDKAGHLATLTRDFLVDSTAHFGSQPMGEGAIGGDVKELQRLLAQKDLYGGETTGAYDETTQAAVSAYNAAHDLGAGSAVDQQTLALLVGSIRIDLSDRKLYLTRDGKPAGTYSVAVGQPEYPTPMGSFEIISKVVDPTWIPPNSEWAKDMVTAAPGPGNPLGTRWMGINSPGIGIHGTYATSSVGTAASHGCMRMHLHEAEELFELVFVGTPVEIVP